MNKVTFSLIEAGHDHLHMFLVDYECVDMPKKREIEQVVVQTRLWCEDQFGPAKGGVWASRVGAFYFWRDDYATAFRMRWC